MMKILVFSGSSRKGNFTQHVAKFVHQQANDDPEIEAELITPQSLNISFSDEGNDEPNQKNYPGLKEKVTAADGFIFVSPEYNHGYSASLKYMIDLNLEAYLHKPVALVGVAKGVLGGARMIENLVPVVRELGLVVTSADLNVGGVKEEIIDGKFVDPEKWQRRLGRLLAELKWMAKTLKHGRENISSVNS